MTERVFPCLLLPGKAEAAVAFYCGLLPGARRLRTVLGGPDGPDAVLAIEFELDGRRHLVLNAGPGAPPSMAVSFVLSCVDQAEIDRFWEALAEGGQPSRCGWVIDRFGVHWQVVPARMPELLGDPRRGERVFAAMIEMGKLDLAALEAA